jgi:voltage-gated potassium channel
VGDPGNFADTPPITFVGRLIACIIGLLGIALFAVPAGLIGSGFSEAMEDEKEEKKIKKNIGKLQIAFERKLDRPTGYRIVPQHLSIYDLQARVGMKADDIFDAVEEAENFRLINLAVTQTIDEHPQDKLAVEHFIVNRSYGCCIDRGSKVTIVFTSGYTEACTGWFAYHIAKLGGFNYIAKDVETDPDNPTSYYNVTADCKCPNFSLFLEDLNRLTSRPGSWAIPVLAASGPRSRPHQFHFCYNPNKKDESFGNPESRVTDFALFGKLFDHVSTELKQKYDYNCDRNIYYAVTKNNIAHLIKADNVFTLRVECFVWMSDFRRVAVVKSLADCINAVLEPEIEKQLPPEMVSRVEGKDFGMQDYVD